MENHVLSFCSSGQNFVLDTLHMLQWVSEVILGASWGCNLLQPSTVAKAWHCEETCVIFEGLSEPLYVNVGTWIHCNKGDKRLCNNIVGFFLSSLLSLSVLGRTFVYSHRLLIMLVLFFFVQVLPFCGFLLPGSSVLIGKSFFSHVKEKLWTLFWLSYIMSLEVSQYSLPWAV